LGKVKGENRIMTNEEFKEKYASYEIERIHLIFCINDTKGRYTHTSRENAIDFITMAYNSYKNNGFASVEGVLPDSIKSSNFENDGAWIRHISLFDIIIDDELERLDIFMVRKPR
jgi:hypothetical protein